MVNLKTDTKLQTIILKGEKDTKYYSPHLTERWKDIRNTLSSFGITINTEYEVKFIDDEYQIQMTPDNLETSETSVLYKDTIIAKEKTDKRNYRNIGAELIIYIDSLKSVYKTKDNI